MAHDASLWALAPLPPLSSHELAACPALARSADAPRHGWPTLPAASLPARSRRCSAVGAAALVGIAARRHLRRVDGAQRTARRGGLAHSARRIVGTSAVSPVTEGGFRYAPLPPAEAGAGAAVARAGVQDALLTVAPTRVAYSKPGDIVLRMYENFNKCDVDGIADCFTEDVVYEDLLLGSTTIVNSRAEFRELIKAHPVFVGSRTCNAWNVNAPELAVKVDSISEDLIRGTIGVEWHVEVGGQPLTLGRGLSFMRVCPHTGLIQRAVDIAEAPWRVVGLLLAPFARGFRDFTRGLNSFGAASLATPLFIFFAFVVTFMDKPSMDSFREDIDFLADFRDQLDAAGSLPPSLGTVLKHHVA